MEGYKKEIIACLSVILFTFTGIAGADTLKFKLGTPTPDSHPYNISAKIFADLLAARSNGRMSVAIHGSGQLGGERTMIEQVQLGTLDFQVTSLIGLGPFTNVAHGFNLPFLFDPEKPDFLFFKVARGPIGRKILDALEPSARVKGIAYLHYDFRDLYNNRKPINSLEDLRGMKFRIIEDPLQITTFRALGMAPVPIPFGEVYTAMQTKVIDGFEGNWTGLWAMKQYEVVKYVTEFGHHNCQPVLIMSPKRFHSLSKEDQDFILSCAAEAAAKGFDEVEVLKKKAREACINAGVKVNKVADMRAFKKAVEPVYKEYTAREPLVKEFVEEVKKLQKSN